MVQMIDNIPVWGTPDPGAVEQIKRVRQTAAAAALMADHHKGYSMPIGGVAAYADHISPSGVGFDIACGNKAVLTDLTWPDIANRMPAIMDSVFSTISFGVGRKNNERVEHALFEDDPAWAVPAIAPLKELGRQQLGTVGSGNHYVDILVDEIDRVWIGVHFGSRGLGHKIATHYLKAAGGRDDMDAEPTLLHVASDLGEQYLLGMHLAGRYAYAGRDWVCAKVAQLLGAEILDEIHNHHNFAWNEYHMGLGGVWVVRKGATPAFPGQRGFVGGSMGDVSVILEGRVGTENEAAFDQRLHSLLSTVHGAGRVMSRTAATGKVKKRRAWVCGQRGANHVYPLDEFKRGTATQPDALPLCPQCGTKLREQTVTDQVRPAAVTRAMVDEWLEAQRVRQGLPIVLRGAGVDEAPHCYKRLPDVLYEHAQTINVLHALRPVGVAMAGPDVRDPYKD